LIVTGKDASRCYVWSRNAQRRDIMIEQRAAIFADIEPKIEKELKAIGREVKEAADEKRSDAQKGIPKAEKKAEKERGASNGGTTSKKKNRSTAKLAKSAGVNRSALERQRWRANCFAAFRARLARFLSMPCSSRLFSTGVLETPVNFCFF
jgi:hypothetical protein